VTTCCSDLQAPTSFDLINHIGKIQLLANPRHRPPRVVPQARVFSGQYGNCMRKRRNTNNFHTRDTRALIYVFGRYDDRCETRLPRCAGHGDRSGDRPHSTVKTQFTHDH
jgi:hypothetical protein